MDKKQYNSFLNEAVKHLQSALDCKNLTLFAGAGISVDSNLPLWEDLISEIKNSLNTAERDYLKVAELFYIQFKENRYYDKITQFFPPNTLINLLHKQVVELNVKNIITTNWDELLEKAIYDSGAFFDIVKDDHDIGCCSGFSKLIKMHGSIDKKNIVFKESDYLNYNSNFPLIENFVKSVFSTDTVLFVGYSLSDINVKQIISWINDKSKSIKPIYFLKVNAEFDYLEFEYFKSKNIFVLYWNESKFYQDKYFNNKARNLSISGQMTYNFLQKISIRDMDISQLSFKEISTHLYHSFKVFENYEYIMPQTVVELVRKQFNLYGINELIYESSQIMSQNKKLNQFLKATNRLNNKNIISFINTILNKARIKTIETLNGEVLYSVTDTKEYFIDNYIYNFNYEGLQSELWNFAFSNNEHTLYLKNNLRKAFLLYLNRDFRQSYELLCQIAKDAFKYREFDVWFIAQFNKKQFLSLLRSNDKYLEDDKYREQVDAYCKDIAKIDLANSIVNLPFKYQEVIKPLYDFSSFIDQKLLHTLSLVDKLDKDLAIWRNGGFSYNQNLKQILQIWEEIELFINSYYLTLEYDFKISNLYKNIFKSIFINKQISKDYSFTLFYISMGIRHFKTYQDLFEFIKKYNNHLFKIDTSNNKQDLLQFFDNLILKILNSKKRIGSDNIHYRYFHNLLVILSYVDIDNSTFKHIVDGFNQLLHKNLLTITEYEVINIFIVNQYNKNKENISHSNLEEIIKEYINCFIREKFSFYTLESFLYTKLFDNIFDILKNKEKNYSFTDNNIIEDFIKKIKKYHLETQTLITTKFLIGIWFVGDDDVKQSIERYYNELLQNNELNDYVKLELLYLSYLNKIDLTLEEQLNKHLKFCEEKYSYYDINFIKIMELIKEVKEKLKD